MNIRDDLRRLNVHFYAFGPEGERNHSISTDGVTYDGTAGSQFLVVSEGSARKRVDQLKEQIITTWRELNGSNEAKYTDCLVAKIDLRNSEGSLIPNWIVISLAFDDKEHINAEVYFGRSVKLSSLNQNNLTIQHSLEHSNSTSYLNSRPIGCDISNEIPKPLQSSPEMNLIAHKVTSAFNFDPLSLQPHSVKKHSAKRINTTNSTQNSSKYIPLTTSTPENDLGHSSPPQINRKQKPSQKVLKKIQPVSPSPTSEILPTGTSSPPKTLLSPSKRSFHNTRTDRKPSAKRKTPTCISGIVENTPPNNSATDLASNSITVSENTKQNQYVLQECTQDPQCTEKRGDFYSKDIETVTPTSKLKKKRKKTTDVPLEGSLSPPGSLNVPLGVPPIIQDQALTSSKNVNSALSIQTEDQMLSPKAAKSCNLKSLRVSSNTKNVASIDAENVDTSLEPLGENDASPQSSRKTHQTSPRKAHNDPAHITTPPCSSLSSVSIPSNKTSSNNLSHITKPLPFMSLRELADSVSPASSTTIPTYLHAHGEKSLPQNEDLSDNSDSTVSSDSDSSSTSSSPDQHINNNTVRLAKSYYATKKKKSAFANLAADMPTTI